MVASPPRHTHPLSVSHSTLAAPSGPLHDCPLVRTEVPSRPGRARVPQAADPLPSPPTAVTVPRAFTAPTQRNYSEFPAQKGGFLADFFICRPSVFLLPLGPVPHVSRGEPVSVSGESQEPESALRRCRRDSINIH